MKGRRRSVVGNGEYDVPVEVNCKDCGLVTVMVHITIVGVWSHNHVRDIIGRQVYDLHHENHEWREFCLNLCPDNVQDN